jgi:hypothetical protein
MSDSIDTAKETIERVHEDPHHHGDPNARNIAILVAVLAVALALTEIANNNAQNAYLTYHVQASDDWAFYQAKTIRSTIYAVQADTLASLPAGADPAVRKRIDEWHGEVKRLDDDEKSLGRKQLAAKARASETARDHAHHRYHLFETGAGALQIAIVLASASLVTRVRTLALAAAIVGAAASLFGLAEWFELF